ncbi:MAG TPA: response regulator, partial [Methanospirillum sp.]|uniref:response regulator n=1 Tax=Methanospirillum sp. TaxID=45200 RepID=UPI002C20928C
MNDTRRYILIAEDSRTQADMLCYLLNQAGYETAVVESGTAALDAVRQRRPDLLLTDIVMPGMDGYELCTTIRSDPAIACVPVILVTQLYDPEDVIRGISCGANNFIIKPYDSTSLIAGIDAVFRPRETPEEKKGILKLQYKGNQYSVKSD